MSWIVVISTTGRNVDEIEAGSLRNNDWLL